MIQASDLGLHWHDTPKAVRLVARGSRANQPLTKSLSTLPRAAPKFSRLNLALCTRALQLICELRLTGPAFDNNASYSRHMSVSRAAVAHPLHNNPQPRSIDFETAHYRVRTLEPADVTERACAWFADPGKARMINAPARAFTEDEFKDFITSHDRVTGHALGIFDKSTGQ